MPGDCLGFNTQRHHKVQDAPVSIVIKAGRGP